MKNAYDTAENSDCLVLLTEWNEFRELDMGKIRKLLKKPNFVDAQNVYEPALMKKLGFNYICLGRNK